MFLSSLAMFSVLAFAAATDVHKCPNSSRDVVKNSVQLHPCKKLPCPLKKGTTQFITIEFTPETELKDVTNRVWASLFSVNLPFIGVDGISICDKIFEEGGDKASCPLKAGNKYIYKDSFPVHTFYPSLNVDVHWALQSKEQDIVCFEVPVKIK